MNSVLILLVSIATLASAEFYTRPSALKVEYISVPESCDRKAMNGQVVLIHYTGTLEDGTKFASDRTGEFQIDLEKSKTRYQAIEDVEQTGLEAGVLGMCIGEKRRLIVPPELGYGFSEFKNIVGSSESIYCLDKGSIIPGGSTLYYNIELLTAFYPKVEPNVRLPNFSEFAGILANEFKKIDINADSALSREEMSVYFKNVFKISDEISDKRVEDSFSNDDKDKNGYISLEEYSDANMPLYALYEHDEL